jgi:hypothetical protein
VDRDRARIIRASIVRVRNAIDVITRATICSALQIVIIAQIHA